MRIAIIVAVLLAVQAVPAAEIWVDAAGAPGGDGSSSRPFKTIAAAVRAANGGDTITVRGGTYSEIVEVTKPGTAGHPTTLRAAAGERVILSGFQSITGWQTQSNGIYTATIDSIPADLFVGYNSQPVARWPDFDEPMRYLREPSASAGVFSFHDAALAQEPAVKPLAQALKATMAFIYNGTGNIYTTVAVKALDPATGTVTLAQGGALKTIKGSHDRYQFANHPSLISKPGQWAFEPVEGGRYQIWFRPADAAALQHTQYRRLGNLLTVRGAYINIDGIEITGAANMGLQINGADHITAARVIAHHNQGSGLSLRRSSNVELRSSLSLANGTGISVASSAHVLIEGNEVALNSIDGIDVAGNVTGRPNGEPESDDVTLRRNYFHHHMLMSHPDNIQTYRGLTNFTIEDTLALWGGQAVMTEETDGARIRNCTLVGTDAIAVIFGHANSHRWNVANSTIGLGGWGSFSFTGEGYKLANNLIFNNPLPLPASLTSDYNVLWNNDASQPVALTSAPRFRKFSGPAQAAEATGQEKHSQRVNPQFRAAPFAQAVAPWADMNRPGLLNMMHGGNQTSLFAVGDHIEINGDGVMRTVTKLLEEAIEFTPPLPSRPFRDSLVWNWKDATTTLLDLRPAPGSPVLTAGEGGTPAGSSIDIPAYQRGDFDGDGKRDLPELPADVRQALPNPNAVVIPLHGA